jgi:hypothetical protein
VLLFVTVGAARTVAQSPALFEFQSAFWVNLHHYLHALGRQQSPLQEDLPATATTAERDAWQAAVASYRTRYGTLIPTFDTPLIRLKLQLLRAPSDESLRGSTVPAEDAVVLEAAAPIYRRYVWPAHDAANRRFITSVEPMLAKYGAAIASRVAQSYGTTWPVRPIRVDAVYSVHPPGGAYTTNNPTHTTIEAADPRQAGFASIETLFHEASHAWGDTLTRELAEAGRVLNVPVPGNLWHAVLFYNAGEITRRVLAEAGVADYRLYMDVERVFADLRPAVAAHWPAFLDGRITRQEALLRILREASALQR